MPLYWGTEPAKFVSLGFELEFDTPFGKYANDIFEALKNEFGIKSVKRRTLYTKSDGKTWDIKPDSSAGRSEDSGWEIASPRFHVNDLYEYLEAVRIIHSYSSDDEIWAGCGFHVHMGLGEVKRELAERFIKFMIYSQNSILTFMPKSRTGNSYAQLNDYDKCKKSLSRYVANARKNENEERYRLINLTKYSTKENYRVEFRHHSGTREPEKAYLWIRTLLACLEASKDWKPPNFDDGTITEFYNAVREVDTYTARWIEDRRNNFINEYGNDYRILYDLPRLKGRNIDYSKQNGKVLTLLALYGKEKTVRTVYIDKKISELSGKSYNNSTLSAYRTKLREEGYIRSKGRAYSITLKGLLKVNDWLNELEQ